MSFFKQELLSVFHQLNELMEERNQELRKMGSLLLKKQTLKIVGQMALLLNSLPFSPTSTMDLDTVSKLDFWVQQVLENLLLEQGMHLESDPHLIWMPRNTQYDKILNLSLVEVWVASPEDVIASKYRFKRKKDEQLIAKYLQAFPQQKEKIIKRARGK